MKKIKALALLITMGLILTACGSTSSIADSSTVKIQESSTPDSTQNNENKKILIVYFSREGNSGNSGNTDTVTGASLPTGNTRLIANQIQENVGGDIFEITTINPYSTNYDKVTDQALQEQKDDFRPELSKKLENLDSYNVVFLGYPNWWGTMPMAIFNFLEEYDFAGKTIVPFCTHEGSRLGRSVDDMKKLCPQSTILDGLAIRGNDAGSAQKDVAKWLKDLGM